MGISQQYYVKAPSIPVEPSDLMVFLDAADASSYPGSGSVWTNLGSWPHNVALNGSYSFDAVDGAIVFDGSTAYGAITDFLDQIRIDSDDFTVEVYVYNEDITADGSLLGSWGDMFLLYMDEGGQRGYRVIVRTSGSGVNATSANNLNAVQDQWQGVCVTYDKAAGEVKLYVDNSLEETISSVSGVLSTSHSDQGIGSENGTTPGRYLDGKIAVITCYNRVLTSGERTSNYNNIISRF